MNDVLEQILALCGVDVVEGEEFDLLTEEKFRVLFPDYEKARSTSFGRPVFVAIFGCVPNSYNMVSHDLSDIWRNRAQFGNHGIILRVPAEVWANVKEAINLNLGEVRNPSFSTKVAA